MAQPRGLYHRVNCDHLKGLRIALTDEAQKHKARFMALGISSKETVRKGMTAVDASPFKTVFVVREASGEVLFALSKNDDYVAAAKKKRKPPTPPDPPLPPATTDCCMKCRYENGTQAPCVQLDGNSCICSNEEGGGSGGLDDELETLGF